MRRRFIPARAGNTRPWCPSPGPAAVHPRTGGEHYVPNEVRRPCGGSSPHGRGTLREHGGHQGPARFIPARAGNTACARSDRFPDTVHPRTGGEHGLCALPEQPTIGSSPHGRGTPQTPRQNLGPHRFIPARAGNTGGPPEGRSHQPVHPRTGGEHVPRPLNAAPSTGSSPHGRGTRELVRPGLVVPRFIPARAGNTSASCPRFSSRTVHPRTGGEHKELADLNGNKDGSSPHGRGTPAIHRGGGRGWRFIPARAGNTWRCCR